MFGQRFSLDHFYLISNRINAHAILTALSRGVIATMYLIFLAKVCDTGFSKDPQGKKANNCPSLKS